MATYTPAPAAADLAAELIADHHTHLANVPIVYVHRDPTPKSKGREVLGRARRVTGLNAFLTALAAGEVDPDVVDVDYTFFVMELALEPWLAAGESARIALVDHELCHFAVDDEDGSLSIIGHDLEEFAAVVERHGLWRDDVRRFAGVCSTVAA